MVEPDLGDGGGADALAAAVGGAYESYAARFDALTGRAPGRFARREWVEGQADARARIRLYSEAVADALAAVRALLPEEPRARGALAAGAKERFAAWSEGRRDVELARTFWSSVLRRACAVVGVDPAVEFTGHDLDRPRPAPPPLARYPWGDDPAATLRAALSDLPVPAPFRALDECAELAAWRLVADLGRLGVAVDEPGTVRELELLPTLFYRNKGAYAVGRLLHRHGAMPVVLALVSGEEGVEVDAVLLDTDEASVVFGFSRSAFHVALEHPGAAVSWLLTLMPHKRLDELYTAIGRLRHGKTELYRALRSDIEAGARFEPAPGVPGLVMIVFTLPTLNVVFKVIRDRFGAPKRTSRSDVLRRYALIFMRDRVGRLADAQSFEHLEVPRSAFHPDVLAELTGEAAGTVSVRGDVVTIEHLYTERRVRPLDLYLEEAPPDAARAATLDYGQAIKDLAAADLFAGDMLVKNFGVTRHGRVVFYDYDEVAPLSECTFRRLPEDAGPGLDEPWYGVAENDVFPEELAPFLGPPGELGAHFRSVHADLFDVAFWRRMQARQQAGEVVDFFPYPDRRRLRARGPRPR